MKNNFITKIIGATVAFAMMIGVGAGVNAVKQAMEVNATIDTANGYTAATMASGTNGSAAEVNGLTAIKVGTSKKGGDMTVTVPSGATDLRFYAAAWNGVSDLSLNITKDSGAANATISAESVALTADAGISNNSPFTLSGDESDYCFNLSLTNITESTVYKFSTSTTKRFVMWSAQTKASGGSSSSSSSQVPVSYTSVTVSEKTGLTGTYKGDAYYECQAAVAGTGNYSSTVTWSITSSNTYGSGTSIADKASIDANGKITFLDNCTVYAWATAADGTTHNEAGFSVTASGLLDNPIRSWTKVTSASNVSVNTIYALSNDGTNFATTGVASSQIALTASYEDVGYFVLESISGGYNLRFATYNNSTSVWEADGNYINNSSGTDLSSSPTASSVWTLGEQANSVYLKNSSNSNRHLGLNETIIKAYATSNIGTNLPVYLYDTGNSLPIINCDTIQLTGLNETTFSINDIATLGYYALGTDGEEWTGDVTYAISNESTSGVVELSATSGASVTLTAKKAGTARVSIQDDAGNADPDYADITVLADPERTELPVGNYDVNISYSGVVKDDAVPESKDYEIKAKEGSGANRVWYKNMTIAYSNITASYPNEYTWCKNGEESSATITTTSGIAKVTQVVVNYYDAKRLTLKDAGDNVISVASQSNNVCTYALNSASFTLSGTTTTASIYSMTITFTAVDENEEFLNLVINKGATATSFTEGDAPNHNGLTVHENYSTDGETISRYEDVTASVTWNYSIETIGLRTTSYTVTATYGGHTSAPVTIDGFTVSYIAKYSLFESSIAEGDYIIYYNGKALQNTISSNKATYSEIEPANNIIRTNNADIVWHIAKEAESDYYTIYNVEAGEYLASTNFNNQAKLEASISNNSRWTVELSEGKFEFVNKAREEAESNNKYLRENTTYGFACYSSSTGGALSLYRLDVEGYLKSASAVATLTDDILRLGSSIPESVWNSVAATAEITDYGVMIYKTDSEANITSQTPVEDAYRAGVVQPAIARTGHGNAPTAVDGNCVFTARMRVSNNNTIFCAASFMVVGGQYYFFNEQHVTAAQLA